MSLSSSDWSWQKNITTFSLWIPFYTLLFFPKLSVYKFQSVQVAISKKKRLLWSLVSGVITRALFVDMIIDWFFRKWCSSVEYVFGKPFVTTCPPLAASKLRPKTKHTLQTDSSWKNKLEKSAHILRLLFKRYMKS